MPAEHPASIRAYVGLGANLDDPRRHVLAAFDALDALPGTRVVARSALYRTAPVGYAKQPEFVNAVAAVDTTLSARELLLALLAVERREGRVRSFRNAPRTLDLDLLVYGDRVLDEDGLHVPHPRMHERAFVMVPLAEIAPDLQVPGRGRAADIAAALGHEGVTRE